jgi:glycosyltransferase involved in cell wall biosynthesis
MNNIIHIIANLAKIYGGPTRSVSSLCDALVSCGNQISLVTQKSHEDLVTDMNLPLKQEVNLHYFNALNIFRITYTVGYKRKLLNLMAAGRYDLIHSHGLWLQCNYLSARMARLYNIPHIVSPRGALGTWAFHHRSWKKMPMWHLWQKRTLESASAFCATSYQEAESIRSYGFRQPVSIIPNGVDIPASCTHHEHQEKMKTALFLSRIHPMKGIVPLVRAWSLLRPAGWRLIIAGYNEEGYLRTVKDEINKAGIASAVELVGPVEGDEKKRLFENANLFLLPSYSENFGIVIAEALSYGIPVITTNATPWKVLIDNRCGWWIDVSQEALIKTLREAISLPDEERIAMGMRGRMLISSEFGWTEIGRKMSVFYDWMLGKGARPDFVLVK